MVRVRGSAFIAITLTCAAKEIIRHAASEDRSSISVHKLTDPNIVADISKHCTLYIVNVPEKLIIDTTLTEPDDVAAKIAAHINGFLGSVHGKESIGKPDQDS